MATEDQLLRGGLTSLNQLATTNPFNTSGFQNQLAAQVRQVAPQISSRFAAAGRTGGGLERVAQTQALADAGARLFSQGRQQQLGAGTALSQFLSGQRGRGLTREQNQLQREFEGEQNAADRGVQQELARARLSAANAGANTNFRIARLGAQSDAARSLLDARTRLALADRSNKLGLTQSLLQSRLGEQQLRLQAAQGLPGLQLAPSDALRGIGSTRFDRDLQRQLTPIQLRQSLAATGLGGQTSMPLSGFTGRTTTSNSPMSISQLGARGGNMGGGLGSAIMGGLGGAGIGAAVGPAIGLSGPWGVAAGAGLGLIGSIF